jgi:ABC-type Fe3+ transport system permease subunit
MWIIWISYTRLNRHTVITLTYRHSEKSFFQRKRDDLILAFISALIGAILGVAGALIVNHYQSKPANQTDVNER